MRTVDGEKTLLLSLGETPEGLVLDPSRTVKGLLHFGSPTLSTYMDVGDFPYHDHSSYPLCPETFCDRILIRVSRLTGRAGPRPHTGTHWKRTRVTPTSLVSPVLRRTFTQRVSWFWSLGGLTCKVVLVRETLYYQFRISVARYGFRLQGPPTWNLSGPTPPQLRGSGTRCGVVQTILEVSVPNTYQNKPKKLKIRGIH